MNQLRHSILNDDNYRADVFMYGNINCIAAPAMRCILRGNLLIRNRETNDCNRSGSSSERGNSANNKRRNSIFERDYIRCALTMLTSVDVHARRFFCLWIISVVKYIRYFIRMCFHLTERSQRYI